MNSPAAAKNANPSIIRLAIALLASPIIAGAVVALAFVGANSGLVTTSVDFTEDAATIVRDNSFGEILAGFLSAGLFGAFIGAAIGWPAMLALGLPAHAFFVRRGLTAAPVYALAGGLAGLLTTPILGGLKDAFDPLAIMLCSGTGFIAASLFWIIRRPDKLAA